MIYNGKFKNVPAICIESKKLLAHCLPDYGCKLVSLIDKETDYQLLAQDVSAEYLPQTPTGNYADSEVSGFDDMFPTIDPCTYKNYYPCHGEVCRVKHEYEISHDLLITRYASPVFDYTYEKIISTGEKGEINISYKITNIGDEKLVCLWAGHIMLSGEYGGYATVPFSKDSLVEIMFDKESKYGKAGDVIRMNGNLLRQGEYAPDGNQYKYYFTEAIKEGKCCFFNPKIGKKIYIRYDGDKLPYLGIWINDGGFKDMYNFAFEPSTLPFDSPMNAKDRNLNFAIDAGKAYEFSITIDVE